MTKRADLIIRDALIRGLKAEPMDIAIVDGKIAEISATLGFTSDTEIDAEKKLVTESFANPHLHLCKVWTLDKMSESALQDYHSGSMGKAMTAIEQASSVKDQYNASWIIDNARRALALAALHGNLHIRAFADVDNKAQLEAFVNRFSNLLT